MYKHSYLDHRDLLLALNQFANIRYAAYRTAAKLKFIQRHTKLDCVKLAQVFHTIEKSGLRSSEKELVLTNSEVKHLVIDIFTLAQKDVLIHLDHKVSAKIVTDLIKETFDRWAIFNNIVVCCSIQSFLFFTFLQSFLSSVVAKRMAAPFSTSLYSSQSSAEKQSWVRNTENFYRLFLTTTGASNKEI